VARPRIGLVRTITSNAASSKNLLKRVLLRVALHIATALRPLPLRHWTANRTCSPKGLGGPGCVHGEPTSSLLSTLLPSVSLLSPTTSLLLPFSLVPSLRLLAAIFPVRGDTRPRFVLSLHSFDTSSSSSSSSSANSGRPAITLSHSQPLPQHAIYLHRLVDARPPGEPASRTTLPLLFQPYILSPTREHTTTLRPPPATCGQTPTHPHAYAFPGYSLQLAGTRSLPSSRDGSANHRHIHISPAKTQVVHKQQRINSIHTTATSSARAHSKGNRAKAHKFDGKRRREITREGRLLHLAAPPTSPWPT
jgi:hypothetical protein